MRTKGTSQEVWDRRYMRLAKEVETWSHDEVGVGAVLVSPCQRQQAIGYNGFPAGFDNSDLSLWQTANKNWYMVHAELNAICNARMSLLNWTLYGTKYPCADCAKAIAQSGVLTVVCPKAKGQSSKWHEHNKAAAYIFNKAGVIVRHLERTE